MQGIPQFNFPLFNAVSAVLRTEGHEIFNPAEKDIERHGGVDISKGNMAGSLEHVVSMHKFSLREALGDDTDFISRDAEGIVLLPGWEHSNGALSEWFLSRALSKAYPWKFIYVQEIKPGLYLIPGLGAAGFLFVDIQPDIAHVA
jgi:hypothetical protein